jgi:hypothetical protein
MAEGQEQRETVQEGDEETQPDAREQAAFDTDPPVDPSEPQVGNSRARFFMPREEGAEEGSDGEEGASDAGDGSEDASESDEAAAEGDEGDGS